MYSEAGMFVELTIAVYYLFDFDISIIVSS